MEYVDFFFFQGLGRRRDPNRSYRYKRDFISWVPPGKSLEDYPNYPLASTYRLNFQYDEPGKPVPQIIVKRPMTSFEGVPTTSYRYSHSNTKHTKEVLDAMTNAAFVNVCSPKPPRSQKPRPESVASCMTWHVPEPPKRTRVPSATQTTDFTQVPVSSGSSCQNTTSPPEFKSGTIAWPHPPQAAETAWRWHVLMSFFSNDFELLWHTLMNWGALELDYHKDKILGFP